MGRALLQFERNATLFIEVLRSYVAAGKFKVHDFVVMPNHVHLLMTVEEDMSIEKAVQFVKGGFSYRLKKSADVQAKCGSGDFRMCGSRTVKAFCGIVNTLRKTRSKEDWRIRPRSFRIASHIWQRRKQQGLKPRNFNWTPDGPAKAVP